MAGTPIAEISVSADLVRGLLADQQPQYARLPISFSGEGWDNFTFRLGDDLAVRLPRRRIAVDLIVNEQRWLPMLAPLLPAPITAPVAIGTAGRGYPWPWSVVPWIDGTPVDHAPLDADQGPVLAGFLRALHQPSPADAPSNPVRGVPLAVRRERIDQCFERLRAASDLITPAIDNAWAEALAAPICKTAVWLHGDMHAQNLLSRKGRLAGVIDWGDMCGGDPATDLGAVWGVLGHKPARAAAIRAYAPDDSLLTRARGWAILFGATLFDNGHIDDPRHAAIGEATLRRLADDLS
jgi:aminoglycoside phosphotransferase (APT) family kinase protein